MRKASPFFRACLSHHLAFLILVSLFVLSIPMSGYALSAEFDFMGLSLDMTQEDIQLAIIQNTNLTLDNTRYLDLMNQEYPVTLKATFFPFIEKIYIDFYDGVSYQLIFLLSEDYFDYFTLADTLSDKYGLPVTRTSRFIKWYDQSDLPDATEETNYGTIISSLENGENTADFEGPVTPLLSNDVRMTLEYPATLKVYNNGAMLKMFTELSQVISTQTNDSVDRQSVNEILGEF